MIIVKRNNAFVAYLNNNKSKIVDKTQITDFIKNPSSVRSFELNSEGFEDYDKDTLMIDIEVNGGKILEISDVVTFYDKNFLSSLFDENVFISVAEYAELKGKSVSLIKKKILEGKISDVKPMYSKTGRISSYTINKEAEILE